MRRILHGAMIGALLWTAGCVPNTQYHWGAYEDTLYTLYAQPETQEQFRAQLLAVIENAARYNKRVPPGVYAEYGYTLYKAGQHEDAIAYFRREQEAWPESSILMERLIANIEQELSLIHI